MTEPEQQDAAAMTPPETAAAATEQVAALSEALFEGDDLSAVIASAERLGVEIDAKEAAAWIAAMEAEEAGGDIVVDVNSGVFGFRATMLDFEPAEIARYRAIGEVVGIPDRAPTVRTALALSGSAAQSRIQRYPGDCDFFERVHIQAPTREAACEILADVMRDKALASRLGPTSRLWEVKFGNWPFDGTRAGGAPVRKGTSIAWQPDEIAAGYCTVLRDGEPVALRWADVAPDPGWCKLDWIVADPARRALANASNVLDVTWEAPDGAIVALDGFIDPYFQEVYLETDSLPVFRKIVHELASDSVDEYVKALQHEVHKYLTADLSYGKVARRLYNIFRLTGRYADAAYLRELFDEPTTVLYQLAALIRTLDDADSSGAAFDVEMMRAQVDQLIVAAIDALDGPAEAEMVARLSAVRESLGSPGADARAEHVAGVKDEALAAVNSYFERRLTAIPSIAAYLDAMREDE